MGHKIVVPVIRRPEYTMSVEQFDAMTFGHCEVSRWNHEVSRRLQADLEAFLRLHGGPIYVLGRDDPRHIKFISRLGFERCGQGNDSNGHWWPLYMKA